MCLQVEIEDAAEVLNPQEDITFFHALSVPEITVADYMARITKYAKYSRGVLVAAMIYLQRLVEAHPEVPVISRTIHRLVITAILVSAKMTDDFSFSNSSYAQIGGVSTKELARLEVCFLNMLDYKLFISTEEYQTASVAFKEVSECCDEDVNSPSRCWREAEEMMAADSDYASARSSSSDSLGDSGSSSNCTTPINDERVQPRTLHKQARSVGDIFAGIKREAEWMEQKSDMNIQHEQQYVA